MSLKFVSAAAVVACLPCQVLALDSSVVGSWSGEFKTKNQVINTSYIKMNIKSVAPNGAVSGVGTYGTTAGRGGACRGDYPLEGTLKGTELDVRGKGRSADCNFDFKGALEGNQLKGTFEGNDVTLAK
jgi:hypothetical protein